MGLLYFPDEDACACKKRFKVLFFMRFVKGLGYGVQSVASCAGLKKDVAPFCFEIIIDIVYS